MRIRGFTLIELLAVIVILAIIALIAVPIILNIIGDTKKESDKRSIEMYGDAVKNAVADYALKHPTDESITYEKLEEEKLIKYEGNKVECSTHKIYKDGNIYLSECNVNDKPVEYEYGEEKPIISYYGQWLEEENLTVGGPLPKKLSTTPPNPLPGPLFSYLKIDTDDGSTISAAYLCFKRNENEYCLKGNDTAAYNTNVSIMKDAVKDVNSSKYCSFSDSRFTCSDGYSTGVTASSGGNVSAGNSAGGCHVSDDDTFCNCSFCPLGWNEWP